jgi:hypothetical protein
MMIGRAIAWLIGFAIPVGICAAALYPPPCEVVANLQQPVADFIVDADTAQAAQANRVLLESKSGTIVLPPGTIVFDQAPSLKSGVSLIGNGTTLTQAYTGGGFPRNAVLATAGTGIGHVDFIEHRGPARIWCGAAVNCPPGTLLYLWISTNSTPSPVRQRRTVIGRSGNLLMLDAPVDQRVNCLKWLADASPIADVLEGGSSVTVTRGTWPIGSSVLVTSGPEIANEAKGELRRVVAIAGQAVTLDRPLRRSYTLAALARVQLVEGVTLRDLTIELPVNKQSESLYASLCRGWRLERCTIRRTAIGNCNEFTFSDCDLGWVQSAASSHDLTFRNCRIQSISLEEGCHDSVIESCRIGPVSANMNCVSLRAQTERITVRDSALLGGGWPSSQILMDGPGRECVFSGLRMSGRTPCWLKGDRIRLSGVFSDGDISITGADASRAQVWAANGRWGW